MRLTIAFHAVRDKDIIKHIGSVNKTYKIKEAIRKAIQFDSYIENIFSSNAQGIKPGRFQSEKPNTPNSPKTDIETTEEVPKLSKEEINKKINQF